MMILRNYLIYALQVSVSAVSLPGAIAFRSKVGAGELPGNRRHRINKGRSGIMRRVTACAVGVLLLGLGSNLRADVVFSEDFSGGNPANASDYTLVNAGSMTTQGNYRVVSNPADPTFTNNYGSVFDHTTGSASGEMLWFDGSANSSDRIFYRSANLTGGVQYQFSYWQDTDNLSSVPNLESLANGTVLGTFKNTATQSWAQAVTTFTPVTSGSYVFSITDLNTEGDFNDGAVDDVQLVSVPEPTAAAIFGILIFGGSIIRLSPRRFNCRS
jgi:hypothetical protein